MAQQTLNAPISGHMPPNTGDSTELGDSWVSVLSKLNAMLTDVYNNIESANNGVTAFAGGGQASATVLKLGVNRVTTVTTAGDSVKLPPSQAGARVCVINSTNNFMQVFGDNGAVDTINGTANATGVSQAGKSVCNYVCGVAGQWESNDTGDGYAGNFSTVSVLNGITAHAGGGQGSAFPLTAQINRVTTVGTAADSVLMPAAIHGIQITVINAAAANSMNVFPATGDAINALGANAAFAVAAGKTAMLSCAVDGTWHAILSA